MSSWRVSESADEPHVFGDIMEQLPHGSVTDGTFHSKLRSVNNSHFQGLQFCFTHGHSCCTLEHVDLDISGLPCQDNSKANKKRKFEEGKFVPAYMVWAKKHKLLGTPLIILENTPDSLWQVSGF